MSAEQYRQTQSPDAKSKKAREDEREVKRRMTTHWDMDQLSREDLEDEMAKGFGHEGTKPTEKPASSGAPESETDGGDGTDEADGKENPLRIGITLLIIAVAMMVGAVLLLQSGAN